MLSRGLGDLPDSWGMLLIWINGSCINGINCTLLLLLIQRCGRSWQRQAMRRCRLSAQPGCVPGPAQLLPVHSSHPGCPQEPPGWRTGSFAWTLFPLPSALLGFFLERLFSKNSLKICDSHTRAKRSHVGLPSLPVRPVPVSSWCLWFPKAVVRCWMEKC